MIVMNEKIQVLNIGIDDCTAKEAMKQTVEYMGTEPVSVIELVTVDTVMYASEEPKLRESIECVDLVLPGEKEILEGADITEKRHLQEVEQRTYLRMFLRYLHKNHFRVFLLVETEEEAEAFYQYLEERYSGIQVAGMAKVSPTDSADDLVVNAVNGAETDCVIAAFSAPAEQEFIVRNRSILNARVWLGIGKGENPIYRSRSRMQKMVQFINHKIFKREIEKKRKKEMETAVNAH